MPNFRTWEVELTVIGPAVITKPIQFNTDKELNVGEVFQSKIELDPVAEGFKTKCTVSTKEKTSANKVALLFVGRMLDVLTIKTDVPFFVSLANGWTRKNSSDQVKAVIEKHEFESAFELSRQINLENSIFHRGLSWYRKGLYTEDPFDKYLAFWNSIEIVANTYVPNRKNCIDPQTQKLKGSKCFIWECFKDIWGPCNQWEIIRGQTDWIDRSYDIRNQIAHAAVSVDIRSVEAVISELETIQSVAYKFLTDLGRQRLEYRLLQAN